MANFRPLSDPLLFSIGPQDAGTEPFVDASEQFLRLRLGSDVRTLLPIQQIIEVLTIPESQIMPIPHMPAWAMGVYNWRGEILWLLDLGHLCGLTPWYHCTISQSTHSIVVLNIPDDSASKGQLLGLMVNQIEDVEWCPFNTIQPSLGSPPTPEFGKFSKGYWQKSDDDILTILDGQAILNEMPR